MFNDEYPNGMEFTYYATPVNTGYLEVDVNGTLVHSKKNGDGYVDTDAKMAVIYQAVEAALESDTSST